MQPAEEFHKLLLAKKLSALSESDRNCFVGLKGSSVSFLLPAITEISNKNIFVVREKREDALYLLNDIKNLFPQFPLFFFPPSGKKPYAVTETLNASQQERNEVLQLLTKRHSKHIIISSAEALFELVPSINQIQKHAFEIEKGSELSQEFLIDFLNTYGFNRADFCLEPGNFSVRGGIIDVFSFASDVPIRIEMDGDKIESIRTFNIQTQLSEKDYERTEIIGNLNCDDQSEYVSILELINAKYVLITENAGSYSLLCEKYFEKALKVYNEEDRLTALPPEKLFLKPENCLSLLQKNIQIEWGESPMFRENLIEFNQSPQPLFHKNFDLLIQDLEAKQKNNYRNILFSDSSKQIERFDKIWKDIAKKDIHPFNEQIVLSIAEGFIDHDLKICCYTDHQIFDRYYKYKHHSRLYDKNESITLKELQSLTPGDFVSHIDHGIGRFAGLEKIETAGRIQEVVKLVYRDRDVLYVSIHSLHKIARFTGKDGQIPQLAKLGSNAWQNLKQKTKKKVKEIAYDLIALYARRKAMKGFQFSPDNYLQHELEASFIYEDTQDQNKATQDVKRDMEKDFPMDRLICGDVGFGKTEVAIRAAFKAVCDGKQVAVLVPTTILAAQHFRTFNERLKELACKTEFVNRFKSTKEQKEIFQQLSEGKIDIIIGTHKLAGKEVKFKDLGLLIIDEEQKFGVAVKDKLKTMKANVDTLTLTATPIPRTLQFSLMGARDLSVIATPPSNRYPVQTELHMFNEEIIRDALIFELQRGGQAFVIHNRVENIREVAGIIQRLVPNAKVVVGHGQLDGDQLEEVMLGFMEGNYDVLVSTTIVESGLDITNANTIIINDAQNFGLSDLHQMRGRVGRSNKKAFCYLMVPSLLTLTNDAKRRLRAITEFNELGSGFQIAMRDLDIRGAGNLMGAEQSGFIHEMGFDTYMKILNEALEELKEEDWYKESVGEMHDSSANASFSRSFVKETQLETDLELLIPEQYVRNNQERLKLYSSLDELANEAALLKFEIDLKDRFGPVPLTVKNLLKAFKIRLMARELGFEKIILKGGKLIAWFLSKPQSPYFSGPAFQAVLNYAQKTPAFCSMKESEQRLSLTIREIKSMEDAEGIFTYIRDSIPQEQDLQQK